MNTNLLQHLQLAVTFFSVDRNVYTTWKIQSCSILHWNKICCEIVIQSFQKCKRDPQKHRCGKKKKTKNIKKGARFKLLWMALSESVENFPYTIFPPITVPLFVNSKANIYDILKKIIGVAIFSCSHFSFQKNYIP